MEQTIFRPRAEDTAVELLTYVFGPAFAHVAGVEVTGNVASASLLSEAFRYFNSGVLVFGMLILTYVTVFAVVNTANDGEVLGKKWSTFYTPLRTMTAATMLIPTASGYALIQLLLFYFVAASIGFASNLWEVAARYTFTDGAEQYLIGGVVDDRNFEAIAMQAVTMQVCAHAIERAIHATNPGSQSHKMELVTHSSEPANHPFYGAGYTSIFAYRDRNWAGSIPLCGTMEFTSRFQTFDEKGSDGHEGVAPVFSLSNSKAVETVVANMQKSLNQIHAVHLAALFGDKGVRPVSDMIIKAVETEGGKVDPRVISQKIREVQTGLYSQMQTAVREGVAQSSTGWSMPMGAGYNPEMEDLIERFTKHGWLWAGSLHLELARVKDAIRSASMSRQEYIPGTFSLEGVTGTTLLPGMAQAQENIIRSYRDVTSLALSHASKHAQEQIATGKHPQTPPKFDSGFTWWDFATGGGSIRKNLERYFSGIGDWIVVGIINQMGKNDQHVLFQTKDIGDYLLVGTQAVILSRPFIMAAFEGVAKTAEAASNQPLFGAVAAPASGFAHALKTLASELFTAFTPPLYILLYIGYFLSIWLPAVPFLVMVLAAVGWVIACLESFIAGSLWVAAHTTPATDNSFIGSQTQGYLLIMSLFFRPALIVFGLIASMTLLTPLVQFTNQAFILFFRMIQADSMIGLFTVAAYMLLYCVLLFSLYMMLFTLPQMLPNRILNWMGTNLYGDLGEQQGYQKIDQTAGAQAKGALYTGQERMNAVKKQRDADVRSKAQQQSGAVRSEAPPSPGEQ